MNEKNETFEQEAAHKLLDSHLVAVEALPNLEVHNRLEPHSCILESSPITLNLDKSMWRKMYYYDVVDGGYCVIDGENRRLPHRMMSLQSMTINTLEIEEICVITKAIQTMIKGISIPESSSTVVVGKTKVTTGGEVKLCTETFWTKTAPEEDDSTGHLHRQTAKIIAEVFLNWHAERLRWSLERRVVNTPEMPEVLKESYLDTIVGLHRSADLGTIGDWLANLVPDDLTTKVDVKLPPGYVSMYIAPDILDHAEAL